MTIGEIIKKSRAEKGMTLDDVGKLVGVSRATVLRWESGEIKKLKRDKIAGLCNALGLDPLLFLSEPEVVTPEERRMLAAYRMADDRARKDAMHMLLNNKEGGR